MSRYYAVFRDLTQQEIDTGIEIRWAGFSQCDKDYFLTRKNKRYFLLYFTEGICRYHTPEGETKLLSSGDILFFKPFEFQDLHADEEHPMSYYGTCFCGEVFDRYLARSSLLTTKVANLGVNNQIIVIFKKLIDSMLIKKRGDVTYIASLLFSLLGEVCNILDEENLRTDDSIDSRLLRIVQYINVNYTKNFNVDDLADIAGFSVSRFEHVFKQHYAVSPKEYIINLKINNAKEIIRYSSLNIADIAYSLGYRDPFYFSRLFKQKTGMSPSEFRKHVSL